MKRKLFKRICKVCEKPFITLFTDVETCQNLECQQIHKATTKLERLPRKTKKLLEESRDIFLKLEESEIEIKEKEKKLLDGGSE